MSHNPTNAASRHYPEETSQVRLPEIEKQILEFWEKDDTFHASIELRAKEGKEFVFYDGPPFANGLPHYGHLLTGFVKDAIPRYKTMRGYKVERRFGWDCHGLPAEMTAERELGVTDGRLGIEKLGISVFNDFCANLVNRTADEWYRYVNRQARWVDFEDDYKTMDITFMESVIWAFKTLYDKGLIYEGYRVLPYCWECETPLSNFETRQDDSYRLRVDPSVTVAFELEPFDKDTSKEKMWYDGRIFLLAWTTTPWTLPSNLAVAVGPEIDYVGVRRISDGKLYVLAKDRLESYSETLGDLEIVGEAKGEVFLGRRFNPIFDYFEGQQNAFQVIRGDFVTTEEGTGVVQIAPGFGEEDQAVCDAAGISVVCPVDDRGRFQMPVRDFVGVQVFEANPAIVQMLREKGVLVEQRDYEHSYPHCWRTDTPLIYKAVSSWFVKVTAIKEQLLLENENINWVPAHVKHGAFGKWLEGARDWSITRNRYWGTPIPVWKSDDPQYPRIDVYGSLDELEADFGVRPANLHRPDIDELTRPNPDDPTGRSKMVRVQDILDCWFESGSMPYAQLHYPFENRSNFEANFPADFIVEYIGQTRGWFYTLHVLSVGLFGKPPFKHCMAHGILLGDDGRKLSKRLKNYPDPWEVFETIGADAMRWFLLSSSILRGQEAILDKSAIYDTLKRVINPIWNAYYFLTLYGNADGMVGTLDASSMSLLDRYILAKLRLLTETVTEAMDNYDISLATGAIDAFLDALTNWYIRRSRDRFWSKSGVSSEVDTDKQEAYNTLHSVLVVLSQISAPLLPMLDEYVYQRLTGERSVHLSDWPDASWLPKDEVLVAEMDLVREVCSLGHSIRKAKNLRARQPLRKIVVSGRDANVLERYKEIIADELNVKEVALERDFDRYAELKLNVVPAMVGPRLGPSTPKVMAAARSGNWERVGDTVRVGDVPLLEGEYELQLRPIDESASRVLASKDAVVTLDLELDEELKMEGLARDVVREIQAARKLADFSITDKVEVLLNVADLAVREAVTRFEDYIKEQTLAVSLTLGQVTDSAGWEYVGEILVATPGGGQVALKRPL
jgi:isoleucyl-tRNA synthetase